jgi:hypothetical protein
MSTQSLVDQLLAEDTADQHVGTPDTTDVDSTDLPLDEEMAMRKIAAAYSILDSEEGTTALTEQNIVVHLNRQSKTNNLAHRQALLLAKGKNDPLYAKYAKFNGIRLQLRELIYRKYGSKAVARARQLMSGVGAK